MLRVWLFVLTCLLLPGNAGPASAQALPPIGVDGLTMPLTPDQLDTEEQTVFAALAPGSDDARKFLYTRGYLRYCRLVAAGMLAPAQLPDLPARDNWDRRFLSAAEAKDVVDVALGKKMAGSIKQLPQAAPGADFAQAHNLPAAGADGLTAPLAPEQLDANEQAAFAALAPGSDDARKFLYTRGFLRWCRLVVAGTLPPLQLPQLPARENWDRKFLSEDEAKNILDVALGMHMISTMMPPPAQ